jgi:hypothetical protein
MPCPHWKSKSVTFLIEVAEFLLNKQGAQLGAVLNEANGRRMAAAFQPADKLTGLDEDLTPVTNPCYVSPLARAPRYRTSFAWI